MSIPVVNNSILENTAAKLSDTPLSSYLLQQLCTQGYCVVNCAETIELAIPLALAANQIDSEIYSQAGIGRQQDFQLNQRVRKDKIFWLNEEIISFRSWFDWLESFRQTLNRELFLGLNNFETHVSLYEPGDFYQLHQDAFQGQSNRRVTAILYLNENWQEHEAGELVLFDRQKQAINILPELGTLVVFLSDEFPHEVKTTRRERLTLTSWLRVDPPLAGVNLI